MANKDHSLDDKIIKAAYSEFLAYGFCKASLHKISEKAGVTTGAIYTRYKNKDALFVALLQDFFEAMKVMFAPVAKEYEKAMFSAKTEDILSAINSEEKIYFELLASHYDDCTLFFSRSDGSSVETMLNDLMEQKHSKRSISFSVFTGKSQTPMLSVLLWGRSSGISVSCWISARMKTGCSPACARFWISPMPVGDSCALL